MPSRWSATSCVLVLLAGAACGPSAEPPAAAPPQLLARETFDWTGESISFSVPPVGWRREGETSGGVKGVRFVKEQSVGEAIGLGDYYILADRHRGPSLRDIIARFDTFDTGFAWDRALARTYARTDTPFTPQETEIADAVNSEVGRAAAAFRTGDRPAAKAHLEAALAEADKLHFSLADVLGRVEFTPEKRQDPRNYHVTGRRETMIAGEPAVVVDYTVTVPERQLTYAARETYVVHNSHLFIFTFIGLPETLAVFDAVIASVVFPK
jgi:hypothetical protein